MEADSIACISLSDGMVVNDEVTVPLLKPQGGRIGTAGGGGVVPATTMSPVSSVHELLECPVCTNSMYPPIHQVGSFPLRRLSGFLGLRFLILKMSGLYFPCFVKLMLPEFHWNCKFWWAKDEIFALYFPFLEPKVRNFWSLLKQFFTWTKRTSDSCFSSTPQPVPYQLVFVAINRFLPHVFSCPCIWIWSWSIHD